MRRLPIYVLLDCSGAMAGEQIQIVMNKLRMMIEVLLDDPMYCEMGWLSLITLGGTAQQIIPLTDLTTIILPTNLMANGGSPLGQALELLCDCVERETTIKATLTQRRDYDPMVFILTEGFPTDDISSGLARFSQKKWSRTACFLINNNNKISGIDLLKHIASTSKNSSGEITGHVFELSSVCWADIKALCRIYFDAERVISTDNTPFHKQDRHEVVTIIMPNTIKKCLNCGSTNIDKDGNVWRCYDCKPVTTKKSIKCSNPTCYADNDAEALCCQKFGRPIKDKHPEAVSQKNNMNKKDNHLAQELFEAIKKDDEGAVATLIMQFVKNLMEPTIISLTKGKSKCEQ